MRDPVEEMLSSSDAGSWCGTEGEREAKMGEKMRRDYWGESFQSELDRLKAELADTTWQDHADAWQKRALKAEAELALCKEAEEGSHKNALYWNEIAEKAEAERDALKALLREFCDDAMLANWNLFRASSRSHMSCSLERGWLQRAIDAALKEKP